MKKTLALILMISMVAVMLPVSAFAAGDDGGENLWPGRDFSSVEALEQYLEQCRKSGSFEAIGGYYATMEAVAIPKTFRNYPDNLQNIAAESYSYYMVSYKFGKTTYSLTTYYDDIMGKRQYDDAKEVYRDPKGYPEYMAQKNKVDGRNVYSYYALGETWYHWKQDGVYYVLRVDKKHKDRYLDYCEALYVPLGK